MKKFEHIDLLRGYAAFFVILYHYFYHYFNVFELDLGVVYFAIGKFGVSLFFMISGFLITMSINNKSPLFFIKMRAVRLLPTYYFCMLVTFSFVLVVNNYREISFVDLFYNLLLFPSWFGAKFVDGSYWTLEYEWVFYLICMVSLLFYSYKYILIVISMVLLIIYQVFNPEILHSFLLSGQASFFLMGILFYNIFVSKFIVKSSLLLFLFVLVFWFFFEKYYLFFYLIAFVFFLAVLDKLEFLNLSFFRFLSNISYPLYLLHQYLGFVLITYFKSLGYNYITSIFISFVIVTILSLATHHIIELKLTSYFKRNI